MTNGIKLIILDYDLTLIDNIIDFYDSFNETLREYCVETVSYIDFYNRFMRDDLKSILPKFIDSESFWIKMRSKLCSSKSINYVDEYTRFFLYNTRLMNMKNVIVSGKYCHKQYIVNDLIANNIIDYIDDIFTFLDLDLLNGVEEELFDKSWLLKYVLNKYGVEPFETVFIGDYYMDYVSCLKTGVFFIGLARSDYRYSVFRKHGVKYIARDFREVFLYLIDLINEKTSYFTQY
ncbi:MAG: HAD hydrolase-like protein [Desulfurococcaceae archaeon]